MSAPTAEPRLTPEEVKDIAGLLSASIFDEPDLAGMLAAVLARRMNEASTREEQDIAGAAVLKRLDAELATSVGDIGDEVSADHERNAGPS